MTVREQAEAGQPITAAQDGMGDVIFEALRTLAWRHPSWRISTLTSPNFCRPGRSRCPTSGMMSRISNTVFIKFHIFIDNPTSQFYAAYVQPNIGVLIGTQNCLRHRMLSADIMGLIFTATLASMPSLPGE